MAGALSTSKKTELKTGCIFLHVSWASSQGFVRQMSRCSLYSKIAENPVYTCVLGGCYYTNFRYCHTVSFLFLLVRFIAKVREVSQGGRRILPASRSNTIPEPDELSDANQFGITGRHPRLHTTDMHEDIQRGS